MDQNALFQTCAVPVSYSHASALPWCLQGQTPLHVAAAGSRIEVGNVLMEYGADANVTDAEVSSMT